MIRFPLFHRIALLLAMAGAAVSVPAAASCSLEAGTTQRVAIGDTGRAMLIHVPQGVAPRAPLVFLLHGSTATGAAMLADSHLAQTSDAHGFILAAPDAGIPAGNGFVWNIPGVPTVTGDIPTEEDPDDVAYLTDAIDFLAAQGCIDEAHVYATGLSGGGRMTSWLGCVASDRFAAIAPVVGLRSGNPLASEPQRPDPATCNPDHPMPVFAFAGDRDNTNPPQGGGAGYWQYSMLTALGRWAELNGCTHPLAYLPEGDVSVDYYYDGCRGDATVIGRMVKGRGHEWVADNEAMWAFFARFAR